MALNREEWPLRRPSRFLTSPIPKSTFNPSSHSHQSQNPYRSNHDTVQDFPEALRSFNQRVSTVGRGVLIGLLSALGSALLFMFILSIIYFLKYTSRGRILLDRIGRPGEYDDEQAFAKEEADALEEMDDIQRAEYMRAKVFIESNPPESAQTDISLSQFLGIQEKGVSAWEFEPALEIANCFVEARTEVEFFDTECSVQTNLPVPKQNEVYYWEAKIYDKPDTTSIGIGMTTKPYPLFKMPGYHKTSVAYLSSGARRFNQPFPTLPLPCANYGPPYVRGDVIGVGYRPRSGTVFFTRNGKKLEDVTHTLRTQNLFPTLGANGACIVHVNFGQAGFVYIEANVKKWGLAPSTGSLAPPPPYGSEQGSILLDQGQRGVAEGQADLWAQGHARSRSAQVRLARALPARSPGPQRSPTDISLNQFEYVDEEGDEGSPAASASGTGYGHGFGFSNGQGYEQITPHGEPTSVVGRDGATVGLGVSGMLAPEQPPPPEYSSPLEQSPIFNFHSVRRGKAKKTDSLRHDYFALPREGERDANRRHEGRYSDEPSDDEEEFDEEEEEGTEYEQSEPRASSSSSTTGRRRSSTTPNIITMTDQQRRQSETDRSPPVPYEVAIATPATTEGPSSPTSSRR